MGRASRTAFLIVMGVCFLWVPATYTFGSGLIEPTRTLEGEKAKPGQLSIFSEPPGLRVLLDGKDVGKTPVHLEIVGIGSHDLRVEGKETTISIAAGDIRRLSFFKGAFIEIPFKEKVTREQPKVVKGTPLQEAGSEQKAETREKLEPGYFPLNPRGPIY